MQVKETIVEIKKYVQAQGKENEYKQWHRGQLRLF